MTYSEWLESTALIEVTGKGDFPLDMLRHDCAWPADTISALNIAPEKDRDYYKVPRTIVLACAKRRFFTPDRWASFGWVAKDRDSYSNYVETD